MIARHPGQYQAFRISPDDTNRLVLVFDPLRDPAKFVFAVEIFDVGGRTPPNQHAIGQEMFFVLAGTGIAHSAGRSVPLGPGDSLFLPVETPHEVENTGPGRLYCLTFMAPDDGFAALIRNGVPADLDEDDLRVLRGAVPAA